MATINEKARAFAALHVAGRPLVLFNAWDPGSAKAIAGAGARAIATGSWSVATAFGFDDGEKLPLALALDNISRIVATVPALPVTIDLESGYGRTGDEVGRTFAQALAAGAVGCNFEDGDMASGQPYAIDVQAARIAGMRAAADAAGVDAFINVRTDLFLNAPAAQHDASLVDDAIARGHAYAKAGASGFFVPGLVDADAIARICRAVPLPVNVMASATTPPATVLASCGVARISHGPGPYRLAMQALAEAARAAHAAG